MCELLKKIKGSCSEHCKDGFIVISSWVIALGLILFFLKISGANVTILIGTIGLGFGFYLKDKPRIKASDYRDSMIGLGGLIALPQTPEMLSKILEINEGVKSLKISQKDIRDILDRLVEEAGRNNQGSAINKFLEAKTPGDQALVINSLERSNITKLKPGSVYLSPEDARDIRKELDSGPPDNQFRIESQLRNKLSIKRVENDKAGSLSEPVR